MTVNPRCPEILDQLLPGQIAFDRPDIVNRIFHAKKTALINNLKHGKYFGGRKCAYIVHVIEFQHRGLPHVHIVYRLENGPDHNDEQACIRFIDTFIIAERPIIDEYSSEEDTRYADLIDEFMLHKCSSAPNGCQEVSGGICGKGYSNNPVPLTHFDGKKYPVYRRRSPRDYYVVPHNREMLLDCCCHVNTEFGASSYCLLYLFKYLYKGSNNHFTFV